MPLETLQATIDRYNELAAAGLDTGFGKPASRPFPIDTPPYYVKQLKAEMQRHGRRVAERLSID